MVNKKEKEILKVILYDLECISIPKGFVDDEHHYKLAKSNLRDVLRGKYAQKRGI